MSAPLVEPALPKTPRIDLGRSGLMTFGGILALFATFIIWAVLTPISGAVITTGFVTISGKPKSIQHLDGGLVQDILVAEGELIRAGQVIIRLDGTLLAANLEIYRGRLAEAFARMARLTTEAAGSTAIGFLPPPDLIADRDLSQAMAAETAIFAAHQQVQAGRSAQIAERILQFENQIAGVEALISAKREQLVYVMKEVDRFTALQTKGLARESDLLTVQSNKADLLGQISEHVSDQARIKNSIRDAELEAVLLTQVAREAAVTELREVNAMVGELTEQIISTQRQLDRVDIRAPIDGYLHDLQVVTNGGVIPPGAVIAQVIASTGEVEMTLQVSPLAIDQVHIGQDVRLRFSALSQNDTPELAGKISFVSATTLTDKVTGVSHYLASAVLEPGEIEKLNGAHLIPGMPVDGFIATGDRSAASYLLKPFTDQMAKAFRE